jgi:hypothetical protein
MTDQLSNFAAAMPEQAAEEARAAIASLRARRQQLLDSLAAVDVKDDEDLRRAIDKIVLAKACREAADAALEPIAKPHREATHAIATVALGFVGELKVAERKAQQSIDAFRTRQREAAARAANEQAEREAELRRQAGIERAAKAAEVKPADVRLGSVRSDYRGQVFDRKVLKATITDPRALPDTILNAPGVISAMETAVRRLAGLTSDIPGATVEYEQKSTVKA